MDGEPFARTLYPQTSNGKRRLTLCNLCLAVFLGLKNTPLSPLAGRSYESINVLHRCCGYTTILLMILHSTIYVSGLAKVHYLGLMMMPGQYAAAVAAICLLCTGVAATRFIRKRQYEIFYIVHVTLAIGILIAGTQDPQNTWLRH